MIMIFCDLIDKLMTHFTSSYIIIEKNARTLWITFDSFVPFFSFFNSACENFQLLVVFYIYVTYFNLSIKKEKKNKLYTRVFYLEAALGFIFFSESDEIGIPSGFAFHNTTVTKTRKPKIVERNKA